MSMMLTTIANFGMLIIHLVSSEGIATLKEYERGIHQQLQGRPTQPDCL